MSSILVQPRSFANSKAKPTSRYVLKASSFKIIASSGYFDDPIMEDPLSNGFNGALCKPYKKKDLNEILNKLL